MKRLYADINKVTQQDDGTLIVSGFASTGGKDSDDETVTPEAMKAALPDYMKFGAVREMHQASAAGTAIRAEVNASGQTEFECLVVDPVAVKKVQTGVYKGFSIGGKVSKRNATDKSIIEGLKLVEVSLVDRPANPEAVISIFKAERTPEDDVTELAELLDKGEVTPAKVLELIKANKPEEVKKNLYDVSEFAQILQNLGYIASGAKWESMMEGDSSPIPASLREWIKAGAQILQAMAAEELQELVSSLGTEAEPIIEMSAKAELAKAGAKFSTSTKSALADVHKALKDCCDKMDGLGYADKDDSAEMAASIEMAKAETLGVIAKAAGVKADEDVTAAIEAMAKAAALVPNLEKRVKELEAMPAPSKAMLKVFAKGDDVDTVTQKADVSPVKDNKGEVNEIATLIKAAHARGAARSTT